MSIYIAVLLQGILQFSFSSRFTENKPTVRHWTICLFFYTALTFFQIHSPLSNVLNLIFLYLSVRLFFGCKRQISALTATVSSSIWQLSHGIVNTLTYLSVFLILNHISVPQYSQIGIAAEYVSLFLGYCFCELTIRHFSIKRKDTRSRLSPILIPALLFFMIGFYIIQNVYGNTTSFPSSAGLNQHVSLLLIQLVCLFAIWSTLYICRRLDESLQAEARLALLEQEAHTRKIYMEEAKIRYDRTRSLRHDMKNHLSVLSGLINSGQTEQAKAFLKKLEAKTEQLSFPVQTGNPVLDILLESKLQTAKEHEITVDLDLALPASCTVDDLDLCIIFSNALDNAITACRKRKDHRHIRICGQRQGDFFLLIFENTCQRTNLSRLRPGIGLSNIRTAAEKYGGTVNTEQKDEHFQLDILLNLHS